MIIQIISEYKRWRYNYQRIKQNQDVIVNHFGKNVCRLRTKPLSSRTSIFENQQILSRILLKVFQSKSKLQRFTISRQLKLHFLNSIYLIATRAKTI